MRLQGLILFCAAAVVAGAADFPPINDPVTGDSFPGKFIWADLYTSDQPAAEAFYTGLFHWTATTIDRETGSGAHNYVVLSNGGRPIAGIVHRPLQTKDKVHGRWVGYVSVDDVPKAVEAETAAGGSVLFPAKDLPGRGTQAIIADRDGAILGLLHSSSGDPGEYRPEAGDWTWAELFASDTEAESQFYRDVLHYEIMPDTRSDRPGGFIFASGGCSRASLAPLPSSHRSAKPGWLLFVRVASVQDTLALASSLGGKIRVAPKDIGAKMQMAIISDPLGEAIGVVELAEPSGGPKEQP